MIRDMDFLYEKMKDEAQQDAVYWSDMKRWLRSPMAEEFFDNLVYGGMTDSYLDDLLQDFDIMPTKNNRDKLMEIADKMLTTGEA
jgi:hypothetical protein